VVGNDLKPQSAARLISRENVLYLARPARPGFRRLEALVTGTTRSSEGLDDRRRRLLYRAWHRGTREMDLIMGRFADAMIGTLTDAELDAFERLSDEPEPDVYAWVTDERPVPPEHDNALFAKLRSFARDGGK